MGEQTPMLCLLEHKCQLIFASVQEFGAQASFLIVSGCCPGIILYDLMPFEAVERR